jgi:adenine-specific DNA-methyltransferase
MAAINDLLRQITDAPLRERLTQEFDRLNKNKKFGLVFEEHIPECTPLYGIPIRKGTNVALKTGLVNDVYVVLKIVEENALCLRKETGETSEITLSDLVAVAQFGEAIFPALSPIAKVKNAPDDTLWHTLIEAENYHALQLLEYLYPKQVDCIYIDPPYNTGVKDWKYNDHYVDASDNWRHSKWLSMMQKRLRIAKHLIFEKGVMVISIGYHELSRLMLLCEELFPDRQIVSVTVQTSGGTPSGGFNNLHEYLVFVTPTDFEPNPTIFTVGNTNAPFHKMTLSTFNQTQRPNQTYPIFIDIKNGNVVGCGLSLQERVRNGSYTGSLADFVFDYNEAPEGTVAIWPVTKKGDRCVWRLIPSRLMDDWQKGYIKVIHENSLRDSNRYSVQFLAEGIISKIESGQLRVAGTEDGCPTVIVEEFKSEGADIPTIWTNKLFYTTKGTDQIQKLLGSKAFSYPKPLDLIVEILRRVAKPESLILDFFSGSGTTLHAVNLLNAEDGGNRRCIIVTNNEVSESETKRLLDAGLHPGDLEWENHGICRAVTWPRTVNTILGKREDGSPLEDEYYFNKAVEREMDRSFYHLGDKTRLLSTSEKKQIVALLGRSKLPQSLVKSDSKFIVSENHTVSVLFDYDYCDEWLNSLENQDHIAEFYIVTREESDFKSAKERATELLGTITVTEQLKRPISEGFATNVEYFKLDFLDRNSATLGRQFHEILPLLWLKSGAIGNRPMLDVDSEPDMMILPENGFAILIDEAKFAGFADKLSETENIGTVYFVTNSEEAFREMSSGMKQAHTYQLYRDYVDNFALGARRNS